MNQTRRGLFECVANLFECLIYLTQCRSSYDSRKRNLAEPNWLGNICPAGHKCFNCSFSAVRYCDGCTAEIDPGSKGQRCKYCRFDLCASCVIHDLDYSAIPDSSVLHDDVATALLTAPIPSDLVLHTDPIPSDLDSHTTPIQSDLALHTAPTNLGFAKRNRMKLNRVSSAYAPVPATGNDVTLQHADMQGRLEPCRLLLLCCADPQAKNDE